MLVQPEPRCTVLCVCALLCSMLAGVSSAPLLAAASVCCCCLSMQLVQESRCSMTFRVSFDHSLGSLVSPDADQFLISATRQTMIAQLWLDNGSLPPYMQAVIRPPMCESRLDDSLLQTALLCEKNCCLQRITREPKFGLSANAQYRYCHQFNVWSGCTSRHSAANRPV